MKTKLKSCVMVLAVLAFGLSACGKHESPTYTYMPDMAYSPAFKAQEEGSMRLPVKGTIPRDYQPYKVAKENNAGGAAYKNPLPRTREVMLRGQAKFNVYCIVCHGPAGEGDGSIVPKFPRPPSLQSDKVRNWQDGNIFHVINTGQGLMPSYATQISVTDRWAIIHYIRALQRSKNPTPADLKVAAEQDGQ
jgi:mono/diheme cytochrome c family protein